ncbi:hypothetical protein FD19_GL000756 [Lacticaseibacillus thailandensis DSM 22698 = JCM 13996]|uniref:Uncharacterized protein n=1 Tax=Lacticaseibacillus thailandensis DSM 22698 = JCM 13996 TaxID=1423810 RepID=A0A0R2CE86_9LACO|nr:hypothetical protein FD19_GL000756 [Lacticaseibacillus thailandensis DSM 22698 = JCM 13996]
MMNNLLIALYALIGAMMALAAIESFRDRENPARYGTGIFWTFLAVIFAFGDFIPATVVGAMLIIIGVLALARQIKVGHLPAVNVKTATNAAHQLGGWIFLPASSWPSSPSPSRSLPVWAAKSVLGLVPWSP